MDSIPGDDGPEYRALARSKQTQPARPQIKYLETVDQSYAPSDSVNDAVWDDAVSWALDNAASFMDVVEKSHRAWVSGNVDEVDRIYTLHTYGRFAPIKHALITARNNLWLPAIRGLAESAGEPTLVLVGAAHVGGADGLVAQLGALGFRLTEAAPE